MVEALTTTLRRLPLLLALIALPYTVCAHRLDEYLQATLVAIEPGGLRLHINLTPGVAVAEKVLGRIDRDSDGTISKKEAAAYAALLKRDLTVRIDDRKLRLKLISSEFPALGDLRGGLGIIQMEYFATHGGLGKGAHSFSFESRHLTKVSVYLLNAAQPKSRAIQITSQERNDNQSAGEIEFTYDPAGAP